MSGRPIADMPRILPLNSTLYVQQDIGERRPLSVLVLSIDTEPYRISFALRHALLQRVSLGRATAGQS